MKKKLMLCGVMFALGSTMALAEMEVGDDVYASCEQTALDMGLIDSVDVQDYIAECLADLEESIDTETTSFEDANADAEMFTVDGE